MRIIAIILLLPVTSFLQAWVYHLDEDDFSEITSVGAFLLVVALLLWFGFYLLRLLSSRWHWVGFLRKPLKVAVVLSAVHLTHAGLFERYCYVWPSIDTVYAPDCTERKFGQVRVGMTKAEVIARIGQPLHSRFPGPRGRHPLYKADDEIWTYTQDGAAPIGDWAWLSRELLFSGDGRVVAKMQRTSYD